LSDKYIIKKKGRDVYLFNMRVSKDLKHAFPDKDYITKSLKTSCIKAARIRRDKLIGELAAKKEMAFNNSRTAFISYVETFKEAKEQSEREERKQAEEIRAAHLIDKRLDESSDTKDLGIFENMEYEDILGTNEFPDAQQAAYRAVKTGTVPSGFRPTLNEALNSWLKRNQRKNADTISKMNSTATKFLTHSRVHDIELEAIHRKDVLAFIEEIIVGYSVSTVQSHLSRLRTIFKHAWQIGLINQIPCPFSDHDLAFYKEANTEKTQMFSVEEIQKIMQWAEVQQDNMGLITKVGLFTGMRISEICNLRAKDVYTEGNIMAFYIHDGKTAAAQRTVPVCDDLIPIIKERLNILDPEALLFGMDGKKGSREFSRFKTAKITRDKSKRFHSFRVHMSTAFDRAGVRERTAAFIVGHKGGETMTYGYYAKADELHRLKDAIEKAVSVIKRDWLPSTPKNE